MNITLQTLIEKRDEQLKKPPTAHCDWTAHFSATVANELIELRLSADQASARTAVVAAKPDLAGG